MAKRGPPNIKITPKDVKSKINTSKAAAETAGVSRGNVTRWKVCHREAPKERAACSNRGSILVQKSPTNLNIMEIL